MLYQGVWNSHYSFLVDFLQVNIPETDRNVNSLKKELCEECDTTLTMNDEKGDAYQTA